MRNLLLVMALLPFVWTSAIADAPAASARSERWIPVPEAADADIRVQMSIASDGVIKKAELLESVQPEEDRAVVEAITAWHFRPKIVDGKNVDWSGIRRFKRAADGTAGAQAVLSKQCGWSGWPDHEAGLMPTLQIHPDSPAALAALPNEIWTVYPKDQQWSGVDPEARLELMVTPAGNVVAARIVDEVKAGLGNAALRDVLGGCLRFAWPNDAPKDIAFVTVPVRFYTSPVNVRQMKTPEYPLAMQRAGWTGQVRIEFTVAEDGTTHDTQVFGATHPDFERAVLNAFLTTRFTPALRFGRPAAVRSEVLYSFKKDFPGRESNPYEIGTGGPASNALPELFRYDTPPEVRLSTTPVYPFALLRDDLGGSASVEVIVTPAGEVWDVQISEASRPEFGQSLRADALGWRFTPARKNKQPSWAVFKRTKSFSPNSRDESVSRSALRLLKALKDGQPIAGLAALDSPLVPRFQAQPVYPRAQLEARTGDIVKVEFFIDRDGFAQLPHAIDYHDEALAWAAVSAVSRWRFDPPLHEGKPIDVRIQVPIEFDPPPVDDKAAAANGSPPP